ARSARGSSRRKRRKSACDDGREAGHPAAPPAAGSVWWGGEGASLQVEAVASTPDGGGSLHPGSVQRPESARGASPRGGPLLAAVSSRRLASDEKSISGLGRGLGGG